MDPIPTWVRRFWDAWDLRVLVLLSFTLQVILSIFGKRRKYISSVWISVLVWSAYLMADWVATVALGKLSDDQGDRGKSNVLWAIWAPLLLLHLGGPDSITAYSLEDNQLWMRHLMGLVVQLFAAVYVILMSWKNLWFSFMSIPALVAGIIKYGERTWVLKSVSEDKYLHRIPLGDLTDKYSAVDHDYVRVLVVAHAHLHKFLNYLAEGGGTLCAVYPYDHWVNMEDSILWDAFEVQMGLMFDLLYTKAAVIYNKVGFIMRCISFGCTVTVLLGLTIQIVLLKIRRDNDDKENWREIDIAITGVLILGALALEIYAAVVISSSNWMMLWLIKQGKKEWVIWLNQRFPWLFKKKKKYWSQMMGQFDLLGYLLNFGEREVQSSSSKIIRSVLGHKSADKWNRYQHKTAYSVHPQVYDAILSLSRSDFDVRISASLQVELDEIWSLLEYRHNTWETFSEQIKCVHLATEICYRLGREWDAAGTGGEDLDDGGEDLDDDPFGFDSSSSWKQNRKVSKALSDYMMYLVIMNPSLLPNVGSLRNMESSLFDREYHIGSARDVNASCRYLLSRAGDGCSRIAKHLKRQEKQKRWEIIKLIWLRTLHTATHYTSGFKTGGFGQKNAHFQQLRQGGELLTLIWFINPRYTV